MYINTTKSMYNRSYMHNTRVNQYRYGHNHGVRNAIVTTAVMIAGSILFVLSFSNAIDTHIENQDLMLCKSAKISGNREYLEKCQCYYDTLEIKCLQKGGDTK
jgi:hypothetical protein